MSPISHLRLIESDFIDFGFEGVVSGEIKYRVTRILVIGGN